MLKQDLVEQGINNVNIIAIGKGQYSNDNSNWTEDNFLPVLNDPSPNEAWNNWGAGQWDLFFLDAHGQYVTDININPWDYHAVYNTIMGLISGCTDPDACNYDPEATYNSGCDYIDCDGVCGGSVVPEYECQNGTFVCAETECQDLVSKTNMLPEEFSIVSIYPNPFNPVTTIHYTLPENTYANLLVYDISGKQVESLLKGFHTAGYHSINWNASSHPSGVYFVQLTTGTFTQVRKLALVK